MPTGLLGLRSPGGVDVLFEDLPRLYRPEDWKWWPLPFLMAFERGSGPRYGPRIWRSITELLKEPRQYLLSHRNGYFRTVPQLLWMHYGIGKHADFHGEDRAKHLGFFGEKQLAWDVEDTTLGLTPDLFCPDLKILWDYKTCTAFDAKRLLMNPGRALEEKPEWYWQVNLYRLALLQLGEAPQGIDRIFIQPLIRDWRNREQKDAARKSATYPETGCEPIEIQIAEEAACFEKLHERISLHRLADGLEEAALPPCSEETLWGGKRCQDYCEAIPFCSQGQGIVSSQGE